MSRASSGPGTGPELALLTELFLSPLDAAGTSRLAEEVSGWPPPESDAEA
ncbi:MAG: hypothetical protein ABR922_08040 [Streptosporangiaceae bacterium]|jgi:hypothetical protein